MSNKTDKQKSYKSARSNKQGEMFEMLILKGCEQYKQSGRAIVEKTPEPFKVVQKEKNGLAVVQFQKHNKAQADFKGILSDGRTIIFEAKCTEKDRIKQNVVSAAQAEQLRKYMDMGAVAGVCVLINKTAAFIPYDVWQELDYYFKRKYITEEEAKTFEVDTFSAVQFLNYTDTSRVIDFFELWGE